MNQIKKDGEWESHFQKPLNYIAVIMFCASVVFGALAGMEKLGLAVPPWLHAIKITTVSFFVGIAASGYRLHFELKTLFSESKKISYIADSLAQLEQRIENKLNLLEAKADESVQLAHLINHHASLFIKPGNNISSKDPHLIAYALTGKKFALEYLRDIASGFTALNSGGDQQIKDLPLTAEFLGYIVEALDSIPASKGIVWMGTSLVVNPDAWEYKNKVLINYQDSLLKRIKEGKLQVFRLFTINKYLKEAERWDERMKEGPAKEQAASGIIVRSIVTPDPPPDFSLICLPTRESADDLTPENEWEDVTRKGWEVVCGIEWMIESSSIVKGARIYSKGIWVRDRYRDLCKLWQKAEDITVPQTK